MTTRELDAIVRIAAARREIETIAVRPEGVTA